MLGTSKPQQQNQDRLPTFRIWGRLLWKEWREDWLPLSIGVGLPLLSRPLWDRFEQDLFASTYGLVICLALLWAVYRTQNNITGANARTALPMPGFPRWLFAIPVPIVVPAVIGLVLGFLIGTWQTYWVDAGIAMMPACALYLMAGYALCTVAASAYSAFPAILVGGGWVLLTNPFEPNELPQKSVLFVLVIAGALLAQAAWEMLAARRWFLHGRLGIAAALVWLALFPLGVAKSFHRADGRTRSFQPAIVYADHYPVVVQFMRATDKIMQWEYQSNGVLGSGGIYHRQHNFEGLSQPLGFLGATRVLVAQQQPDEDNLRLLEWDVAAYTVREIITFRPGRYALHRWGAEMSPDGHYLLFFSSTSPSSLIRKIPIGYDLWAVDLAKARIRLAAVGMKTHAHGFEASRLILSPTTIRWGTDRVIVTETETGREVAVDLATLRGRTRVIREAGR